MIRSIKYFLLISLLISITIASAINGVGNYILDEKVIQPYLDDQLIRIHSLAHLLTHSANLDVRIKKEFLRSLREAQPTTKQKVIFQVWSKDELLMSTAEKSDIPLKDVPIGFSNQHIHGDDWRIYSSLDDKQQMKIIVAELYNLRRELADDIARSNANILLITYPVFGFSVWFLISFALRSVSRVTDEISNRASTYLEPVDLNNIPQEIKPMVAELNQLFIRLKLAFERNKRFAADAAHELRTPLAALKTHVQLALASTDDEDRNKALQKVILSVDRNSHVVAQLLTLSHISEEEVLIDVKPLDLHKVAMETLAFLAPLALEKHIEIELLPAPTNSFVLGSEAALGILIRNIVDNAIRYTPQDGIVQVQIVNANQDILLIVNDSGPGIPNELRERVFERFYRIIGSKQTGSGLGLAIVSQIAALHHATINLSTPADGKGLQFEVAFPKYQQIPQDFIP